MIAAEVTKAAESLRAATRANAARPSVRSPLGDGDIEAAYVALWASAARSGSAGHCFAGRRTGLAALGTQGQLVGQLGCVQVEFTREGDMT
ncbi:hypothetical protein [Streptomyces sp. NPDC047043]|uniref:hypothetical protein n=1 Tax=Streptomyces sp. NPDC047043 TaxID=3154497 RepID=UPI0033F1C95C